MLPSYKPGQIVAVTHARRFSPGDVVVASMDGREVIKRIVDAEDGQVFLRGDNATASTDSRQHGWLNDRHVVGRVVWPKRSLK